MRDSSTLPSSGVWKLSKRPETDAVLVDVHCHPAVDKDNLLAALAQALQLPDDFGMNWDAAWDCLNDPHWMVQRAFILHLSENLLVDDEALSIFLEIFSEACDAWRDQEQNLLLLIVTTREDIPCLRDLIALPDNHPA